MAKRASKLGRGKENYDEDFDDLKSEDKKQKELEFPLPSLFESKMERRFKGNADRKNLLHRFVYVAKIREDYGKKQIEEYYKALFETLQVQTTGHSTKGGHSGQGGEGVTGLLLVYPKHCIHIIETTTEIITGLVRDIEKNMLHASGPVENAKILVISHDIPENLYGKWSFCVLDIQSSNLDLYEPGESNDKLVSDMLRQTLQLGSYLAKQPQLTLKNAMDTLHEKVPELLPQQDIINYLTITDDNCMSTPREYLNRYEKPFDVILASEMTWPLPINLFPYN